MSFLEWLRPNEQKKINEASQLVNTIYETLRPHVQERWIQDSRTISYYPHAEYPAQLPKEAIFISKRNNGFWTIAIRKTTDDGTQREFIEFNNRGLLGVRTEIKNTHQKINKKLSHKEMLTILSNIEKQSMSK